MTFDIERSEIMNFDGIECFEKDGVVYLKLETVARGLGFTRIADSGNEVVRWERVEKYLRELNFVPTCGHDSFIPENIFYRLAMKAKNEAAEQFQAKIADEVIPSIRKYGAYLTLQAAEAVLLNPDTIIQLATQIKEEQARRMELEEKIEADAPKVLWAEQCLKSKTNMTVEEFSQIDSLTGTDDNLLLSTYSAPVFLETYIGLHLPGMTDEQWNMVYGSGILDEMPCYPADGSIILRDGVVIVKLGETG